MMIGLMKTTLRSAGLGLALIVVSSLGFAQTAPQKSKPPAAGSKALATPSDRVLTPAQLRDCLDQQTRVESDAKEADREREAIESLKGSLKTSGTALDESLAGLDRADPVAVDGYNARVKEREEKIGSYESRVAAYNGRVDGIRGTREAFSKTCGNRRYDVRDLDDLNRTKKK